jgi:dTDP-4-amino-4,6-dideoxygalactose transaminase
MECTTSTWAQYTILLPKNINRSKLVEDLKEAGVPTMIYYVKPLHLQTAYQHYPTATGESLPVCEALAHQVLSLPMSGYVREEHINIIKLKMDDII